MDGGLRGGGEDDLRDGVGGSQLDGLGVVTCEGTKSIETGAAVGATLALAVVASRRQGGCWGTEGAEGSDVLHGNYQNYLW